MCPILNYVYEILPRLGPALYGFRGHYNIKVNPEGTIACLPPISCLLILLLIVISSKSVGGRKRGSCPTLDQKPYGYFAVP